MLMAVENMHAECTVIQVLSNVLDCLLRFSSRIVTETSTSVEMHHQGTNLLLIKVIFHT